MIGHALQLQLSDAGKVVLTLGFLPDEPLPALASNTGSSVFGEFAYNNSAGTVVGYFRPAHVVVTSVREYARIGAGGVKILESHCTRKAKKQLQSNCLENYWHVLHLVRKAVRYDLGLESGTEMLRGIQALSFQD